MAHGSLGSGLGAAVRAALVAAWLAVGPAVPADPAIAELDRLRRAVGPLTGEIAMANAHRTVVRTYGREPDRPVPAGSARKWITAAMVLSLVDDGLLGLDDPVGRFLPAWAPGKDRITVRMLLSHSAGLPARPLAGWCSGRGTLGACVDALARVRLLERPGSAFRYGSIDYNVAARVAEVASGEPYRALVQSRVLRPLGMTSTELRAAGPGLPDMVGELWTTPRDFVRFLGMVLGRGRLGDVRVLSEAAIDEMERGQNGGLPKRGPVRDFRGNEDAADYGLGMWRSRVDDADRLIIGNTVGRGGFAAWIDLRRGVAGVLTAQPSPLNSGQGGWDGLVDRLGDAMSDGRL